MSEDILWGEIEAQPSVLARLIERCDEIELAARVLAQRDLGEVRLVAHGSSDNTATYGIYALALLAGIGAFRDSVSLPVYYGTRPTPAPVIAISQSGRTPDLVDYLERARAASATTIAITNDLRSPLAECAEFVIDLGAGPERSVAATKTYTSSLAALALLAAALGGKLESIRSGMRALACEMPAAIAEFRQASVKVAPLLAEHDRLFVIGRGLHYSTAREIALKLTECGRVLACGMTATDFLHGPIAALDRVFPVWAVGGQDVADPAVERALGRARDAGAPTIATAPRKSSLAADFQLVASYTPPPLLAPITAGLSGQVMAHALLRLRGHQPDRYSNLISKVTLAP